MGNEQGGGRKKKQTVEDQLFDASFEMKQQAKMLDREAMKLQQSEQKEKAKIQIELKKGNLEFAKLYAENSIRLKKESLSIQRFSAKMSAVSSKLESAMRAQQISIQIKNCVPKLNSCLKQMNSMKITENMANFEKVFEDLDVKAADINGVLESVTGSSVQQDEVTQLLNQMMEAQGMDVGSNMVGAGKNQIAGQQKQQQAQPDDMQSRLNALKNI